MTDQPTTDLDADASGEPDESGAADGGAEAADEVQEVWTYAGRRLVKGKRYHVWHGEDGDVRYYATVSASMIGGRYTVTVSRTAEHTIVHGEPRYTGEYVDDRTRREMEALDIAAMAAFAAKTRERNDSRQKALDTALQPLVDLAAKTRFGHERDALLAYVIRRVTNRW